MSWYNGSNVGSGSLKLNRGPPWLAWPLWPDVAEGTARPLRTSGPLYHAEGGIGGGEGATKGRLGRHCRCLGRHCRCLGRHCRCLGGGHGRLGGIRGLLGRHRRCLGGPKGRPRSLHFLGPFKDRSLTRPPAALCSPCCGLAVSVVGRRAARAGGSCRGRRCPAWRGAVSFWGYGGDEWRGGWDHDPDADLRVADPCASDGTLRLIPLRCQIREALPDRMVDTFES
jgi:hypothetical protein